MAKHFLIIILLVLTLPFIKAKGNQYNFGHFDYSNGLSNNRILCFAEDNNGFIWIGTTSGLNRYDGYNFKVFRNNPADSSSIPDDMVQAITKDQLGRLWVLTTKGMAIFNPDAQDFSSDFHINLNEHIINLLDISLVIPYGDSTLLFHSPATGIVMHNIYTNQNKLIHLSKDNTDLSFIPDISHMAISNELLYILHRNGRIEVVNLKTLKLERDIHSLKDFLKNEVHDYQLFIDNKQYIWVYSNDEDFGIIRIDNNENTKLINTESKPALNSNIVSAIIQDSDNNYWIGTDHGGLNILDSAQKTIEYIKHDESNKNSLSQNVVTELFKSSNDIIWIGSFKQGANYYHKNLFRFFHYKNQPNDKNSLCYNDVNCFAEDKKGNLWIGTNGQGILYFDRKKNIFTNIPSALGKPNGLQSNVIVSLYVDKKDNLWIGTYHGGLSFYDGQKFTNYLNDPDNPKSISDNRIWEIFEDSKNNLWIGTLGGGLDLFDRDKNIFQHFSGTDINSVNSDFVIDINEDEKGNLWFGTDYGLYIYSYINSKFDHLIHDETNDKSLSNNLVSQVFVDSHNNVWIGTRNGLNLYNKRNKTFTKFNTSNGLPNNSIMGILESDQGDIWISTSGGLSKIVLSYNEEGNYKSHYTVNFNESEGLQGREFNEGSAFKTKHGELIFGGSNGFNLFYPDKEEFKNDKNTTLIIGLEIFGKEVEMSSIKTKKKTTNSSILNGETIKLPYKENIFSLKFVTINYLSAKKISYRYRLEGFSDQWINSSWEERKATFTNLNPGKYVFKVQSTDHKSDWSDSESLVNIIILPPWYRTWIAYIGFSILLVLVAIVSRRLVIRAERAKFTQEQTEKESKRQHELNALKTRFFTNVSHEFRTPLTLILTPLEKLIKTTTDENASKHLALVYQNAKRLLNLVNQLLDFRKVEENKLQVNYIYGNVVGFIRYIIDSFADFRDSKNIDLDFFPDEKELFMQFDKDKLEKIIFNLLSNAFKFTPEHGYIRVFTEIVKLNNQEFFKLLVKDSGIGISREQQEKIFERFYQSELPNKFITRGSGIGLSLTQDFVELMNGTITVQSQLKKGSSFIVMLPINRNIPHNLSEEIKWAEENKETATNLESKTEPHTKDKKTVMLVEDNADFRFYLNDSLRERFNVLEAENGKLALEALKTKQPDLIVSDVMMPEMDGLAFCNEIKTNPTFSHIPVILLTAKSTQQDKLDGLHQGADEYITKPFNLDILEARIDYLLAQREKFIEHYQKDFQVESDINSITPLDEKLLKKINDLINKNLSNSEYSVEKLSKEIGMSRVYLYKKTTSLTGKTPVELIRLIRLKKASDLILNSDLSISEIAYEVGFTDPKYFSKMFKMEIGVLPSKFKENQGM